MENESLYEMYGNDDDVDLVRPMESDTRLTRRGVLTEVKLGDQSLMVVDPSVVQKLESTIRILRQKISLLEQDMRNMKSRMSVTERGLNETKTELNTKISYE